MIHHDQALTVIAALDIDAQKCAFLERYVSEQKASDEAGDPKRLANAAERRSDEAIARVATLNDDHRDAVSRIVALEDQLATVMEIIIELSS